MGTGHGAPPRVPAEVEAAVADYPDEIRDRILQLRALVWAVASDDARIGPLEETLTWGQPSYRPATPRTGTTVRIDRLGDDVALFTHCQTSLVDEFRDRHGDLLPLQGTRAVVVPVTGPYPEEAVRTHVRSALLYFRR